MKTIPISIILATCVTMGTFTMAQAFAVRAPYTIGNNHAALPQVQMAAAKLHFAIKGVATDDNGADDNGKGDKGKEAGEHNDGSNDKEDAN